MITINSLGLFTLGLFLGFVVSSFLISLQQKDLESENIRLRTILEKYRQELSVLKKSAEKIKNDFELWG
jgi:uncharacterized membrane-anchored protein YhcB (DUF1043 family)